MQRLEGMSECTQKVEKMPRNCVQDMHTGSDTHLPEEGRGAEERIKEQGRQEEN